MCLHFACAIFSSPSNAQITSFCLLLHLKFVKGHPLSLSSYLIKPVQRIQKYHLFLDQIAQHCAPSERATVQEAHKIMLTLGTEINSTVWLRANMKLIFIDHLIRFSVSFWLFADNCTQIQMSFSRNNYKRRKYLAFSWHLCPHLSLSEQNVNRSIKSVIV